MKYVCPLIVVKDMKVARNFYENFLGQRVIYDFGENVTFEGNFALHLEKHYKSLLGEKGGQILSKSNNFELYFETYDIDRIFEQLKNSNIEFLHEVREQPWGQRVMRFYDPDFHIIEVGETMDSVVLRYYKDGMQLEDIVNKTLMPKEFIQEVINENKY